MKNNNNNYNEKKNLGKIVFGLLPKLYCGNKILGCNTVIVLQRFRLGGYWKVYCNTLCCIAGW